LGYKSVRLGEVDEQALLEEAYLELVVNE